MLDIHIGVTRPELVKDAIASLSPYSEWVNVHLVEGKTKLYDLRKEGYSLGTAEYVSFLDDDDIMMNMDIIKSEIEKGTPAFFTNSTIYNKDTKNSKPYFSDDFVWGGIESYKNEIVPHNPFIVKRSLIQDAFSKIEANKTTLHTDLYLEWEIQKSTGWTYIKDCCYRYTINSENAMHNDPTYKNTYRLNVRGISIQARKM